MAADNSQDDQTQSFITLTKGTMVSHYRIIEKIGAGGMGEVYLAEDTDLDRNVALKFLPLNLCRNEEYRARFKREAQAAAALKHTNIITIHEVSEFNGRPFIVMEYIEGKSLRDKIKEKKLTINDAIDLTMQICAGLNEAHEAGIVHRDLKPANILLDKNNQPIILDFGLATIKGTEKLTKTGSTLGTVGYLSPEQARGATVGKRSDLFSVGVILYEMITGKQPFYHEYEASTMHAILNEEPEPIARFKSSTSAELQQVIDKALSKDISIRYQTAAGLQADLKRLRIETKQSRKTIPKLGPVIALFIVVISVLLITKPWREKPKLDDADKIMLAVLPFENLGSSEDDYFADGITESITSRLSALHGLGVISRTSTDVYKGSNKTLPKIAQELGVDFILEGKIQWDKSREINRIRITPQLIDVSDDSHLWSDIYDRQLDDIFAIQTDISENVAKALGQTLIGSEREALKYQPTKNIAAYQLYIKGREARHAFRLIEAIEALENAITMQPDFALAHAEYSRTCAMASQYIPERSDELQEKSKYSALDALKIDPNLQEAHLSLAYYHYRFHRDYKNALNEIILAQENKPSNSEVLFLQGLIRRRQEMWSETKELMRRAIELDPFNPDYIYTYYQVCLWTRDAENGINVLNRVIETQPDKLFYRINKANLLFIQNGLTEDVLDILNYVNLQLNEGSNDYLSFTTVIQACNFDLILGKYKSVIKKLNAIRSNVPSDGNMVNFHTLMGQAYLFDGNDALGIKHFDTAIIYCNTILSNEELSVENRLFFKMKLGYLFAEKNNEHMAKQYFTQVFMDSLLTKDRFTLTKSKYNKSEALVRLRKADDVISLAEELLNKPSPMSVSDLKYNPIWDPIRDYPPFKALIEKYENEYGI